MRWTVRDFISDVAARLGLGDPDDLEVVRGSLDDDHAVVRGRCGRRVRMLVQDWGWGPQIYASEERDLSDLDD